MGRSCKYCKKQADGERRMLYGFPLENADLCDVWKERLELPSSFVPTKYTKICSDHFSPECFNLANKRKKLVPGSVPSFFSERKHACFYCNATRDSKPGLSLRKFPLNKPYIMEMWLKAINMEYFIPDKDWWICSDHFEDSCFLEAKNRKRLNLKYDAVPTLFFKEPPKALPFEQVLLEEPIRKSVNTNHNDAEPPKALQFEKVPLEEEPIPKSVSTNHNDADSFEVESYEIKDVSTSNSEGLQNTIPKSEGSCEQPKRRFLFTSVTPSNPRTIQENRTIVNHDHRYHSTPTSVMKELIVLREKYKESQLLIKTQRRHISRLISTIKSSKDKIKKLRKRN